MLEEEASLPYPPTVFSTLPPSSPTPQSVFLISFIPVMLVFVGWVDGWVLLILFPFLKFIACLLNDGVTNGEVFAEMVYQV